MGKKTDLDVGEIETNVGFRCDGPVLVTALGETFYDVGLVTHEPEETHDFFTTDADPVRVTHWVQLPCKSKGCGMQD
jgi:hypothetical protein